MANIVNYIISLTNRISGPLSQANNAVNRFNNNVNRVNSSTSKAGSAISNLGAIATRAFAAIAVGSAITGIAKMGMNMEQTRISFETFLGSAEKGNAMIQQLQNFALATPFEDEQVLKAGKSLLAFGVKAEDMQKTLSTIGNISSAVGKDFNELALIYGKAQVAGTLYAEDINQLTEAGIPVMDLFAKKLGVSTSQVKKMASEGKLSFDIFKESFEELGGAGGRWGDLMEKQSKTVAGRLSSLKGFAQNLGSQLGEMMLPMIGNVVDAGNTVLQFVNTHKERLGKMFDPLKKAVQPLLDSFKRIADRMGLVGDSGSMLESVFNKIAYAIQLIAPFIEVGANMVGFMYENIAKVVKALWDWGTRTEWVGSTLKFFYKSAVAIFTALADIAKNIFGGISDMIQGVFNPNIGKGAAQFKQGLGKIGTGLFGSKEQDAKYSAIMNGDVPSMPNLFGGAASKSGDTKSNYDVLAAAGGSSNGAGGASAASKQLSNTVAGVTSQKPTTLNISIQKLVESLNINTTNINESKAQLKDMVAEALTSAINDVSLNYNA